MRSGNIGYFCNRKPVNTQPTKTRQHQDTHIVQRSIRADRAPLLQVPHPAHDRRDTARAQPRRAPAHKLRERAEELALGERRLEREEVVEDADDHEELLGGVHLHEREEGGVERVRDLDLVRVLPEEEHALVDELADDEPQDLAEVPPRDELLECLLAGLVRGLVDDLVVLCAGEVLVLERVERALGWIGICRLGQQLPHRGLGSHAPTRS